MKKQTWIPVSVLALSLIFSVSAGAVTNDIYSSDDVMHEEVSDRGNDSTDFSSSFSLPTDGIDLDRELASRITYPAKAIVQGIEGEVLVLCTVDLEGKVSDVKILKDIGGDCALAATRAVRNMKFHPAMQNGFPRPFTMIIPVQFSLEN